MLSVFFVSSNATCVRLVYVSLNLSVAFMLLPFLSYSNVSLVPSEYAAYVKLSSLSYVYSVLSPSDEIAAVTLFL